MIDVSALPFTFAHGITVTPDGRDVGSFLRFTAPEPAARHIFAVGDFPEIVRWVACHRYEPYWMTAKTGTNVGAVPVETQYLLAELADGRVALFVPLIDGVLRASLQGDGASGLSLVAESGDPAARQAGITGLFVAVDVDPYKILESGSVSVARHLRTPLRWDKPLPAFCDSFGWCTWDAFYGEVSHNKVREGLESFRAAGITPRVVILDDGWKSTHILPTKECRLTAFAANDKFGGDLTPTVTMAKGEYGVETFLVWHAVLGHWGGVDETAFAAYDPRVVARDSSEGIRHHVPTHDTWFGATVGVVPPAQLYRFYQDYHRSLRAQGVDGVKVDGQAALETVARGLGAGGRVPLMRACHEALEGSVAVHFGGNLINCMSCANDMLYQAPASNLTRTSTDFWPNKPESHGLHLWVNAMVGAWFGNFVHPDWDMFQSGHPLGAFHAAGRAVSGAPLYVSDKPGAHDVAVLKKLVTPDGRVLRFRTPGLPTSDCLFADVTTEPTLLKIHNSDSVYAHTVAAFNARYAEGGTEPINGAVSAYDSWSSYHRSEYVAYAHGTGELRAMAPGETWEITLPQLGFEVFTFVLQGDGGFTPIGITDYYHCWGAIIESNYLSDARETFTLLLKVGGNFLAYAERAPESVTVDEEPVAFEYDAAARALRFMVAGIGDANEFVSVRVAFS